MAELYFVRHGQASFGSPNYDQLSELGFQQCQWLGEYFRQRDIAFDRVICGEMVRHHQTAETICAALAQPPRLETHAGFNEFDFKALLQRFADAHPDQAVDDWGNVRQVYRCLRAAMLAWAEERLPPCDSQESWSEFRQRVAEALGFARRGGRTLISTSGGAISMALSQLMGFGAETLVNLNMQSRNAAITHCFYTANEAYVTGFNQVPHLDTPERLWSITLS
ncbi:Broad specificity phosphatase PhoE [Microbulbifer donghaiensis]|uniref:Broad specificity phosphatase PhoE n=1 Tax=Microbulbifer donghaiensis TaxID=494016 RepID=A0A1M5GBB7_9GAMM|nr:histidine phosphatase family protein [Microbulbifer donghaiensis]SHG00989.1 Broad specificity phosphatase PhoE [Microbulbifer donghaiensis]